MGTEHAVSVAYWAMALFMMYPIAIIIFVIIVFYLIHNRIKEKKEETFEKRDN